MLAGAALLALFGLWLMLRDRRKPPVVSAAPKLAEWHALFPKVAAPEGCSGPDTCADCLWGIALAARTLIPGRAYPLPSAPYDLLIWDDGSYSVLPAITPELN